MSFVDYSEKIKRREKTRPLWLRKDEGFVNLKIGGMVKRARLLKGLTQAQLAERVGTKQSSIARLESGRTAPSISFLNEIAKALDTYLVEPRFKSVEHFYADEEFGNNVFENMQEARNYVSICYSDDLNLKN